MSDCCTCAAAIDAASILLRKADDPFRFILKGARQHTCEWASGVRKACAGRAGATGAIGAATDATSHTAPPVRFVDDGRRV